MTLCHYIIITYRHNNFNYKNVKKKILTYTQFLTIRTNKVPSNRRFYLLKFNFLGNFKKYHALSLIKDK